MAEQTVITVIYPLENRRQVLFFNGQTAPKLTDVLLKIGFNLLMDPETMIILHDPSEPITSRHLVAFNWTDELIQQYNHLFSKQEKLLLSAANNSAEAA